MIMIRDILDRKGAEVFTIRATDTVQSAADRMREHGIASLVVKSGDRIEGLISERDIVHAVSRHGEGALSLAVSRRNSSHRQGCAQRRAEARDEPDDEPSRTAF